MSEHLAFSEKPNKKAEQPPQPILIPRLSKEQGKIGSGSDYETVRERVELLVELEKYEKREIDRRKAIGILRRVYGDSLSEKIEKAGFDEVVADALKQLRDEKKLLKQKSLETVDLIEKRISEIIDVLSLNFPRKEDPDGNDKFKSIYDVLQLNAIYGELVALQKNMSSIKERKDIITIPGNYMVHLLGNLNVSNAILGRVAEGKRVDGLIPSFREKIGKGLSCLKKANHSPKFLKELLETQSGRERTLH